jgi:hypothetical protein
MKKRLTKKEALAAAGYVPQAGRASNYGEKTEAISFRCPESLSAQMPAKGPGRGAWLVDAVKEKIQRS